MNAFVKLFRSRSILVQLMLFLSILLLIVLGSVFLLLNHLYVDNYTTNCLSACIGSMERARAAVDEELLLEMRNLTDFFADKDVNRTVVAGAGYEGRGIIEMSLEINRQVEKSDWLQAAYLYVYAGEYVITSDRTIETWEDFSEKEIFLRYQAQVKKTQDVLVQEEYTQVLAMDDDVFMFRDFPVSRALATAVLQLEPQKLYEKLEERMGTEFLSGLAVYDSNWNSVFTAKNGITPQELLLLESRQEGEVTIGQWEEDTDVTVLHLTSSVTGWHYMCFLERSMVVPEFVSILQAILPIVLVLLVVLLLFAVWLVRYFYSPVSRIVQMMTEKAGNNLSGIFKDSQNEYKLIGDVYQRTQDQNNRLNALLSEVSVAVTEKVLRDILMGDGEADKQEELRQIGSPLAEKGKYTLLDLQCYYIHADAPDQVERAFDAAELLIKVREYWLERCLVWTLPLGPLETLLILRYSEEGAVAQIKRDIQLFEEQGAIFCEGKQYEISIGRGEVCESVYDLSGVCVEVQADGKRRRYFQGRKTEAAGEYKSAEDADILSYQRNISHALKEIMAGNPEPAEHLNRLLSRIEWLEEGRVRPVIQGCLDAITEKLSLLPASEDVDKIWKEKEYLEEQLQMEAEKESFLTSFRAFCFCCLSFFRGFAKKEQYYHIENAQKFITTHYFDSSMSLEMVSSHLRLSASYLSALFVEYLPPGFVDYLSRFRLEQAKKLLRETDLTVAEIGYRTGFNSPQNFIRVFKKYSGIPPGKFREEQRRR